MAPGWLRAARRREAALVRDLARAHRGLGRRLAGRSRALQSLGLGRTRQLMREALLAHAVTSWAAGWRSANVLIAAARPRFRSGDADVPDLPREYSDWYEATVDDALHRYEQRQRREIAALTLQGATEGWGNPELAAAIQGKVDGMATWQAMRIARTESMRLYNLGRFARMEAEEAVVGYRYVVTRDTRTSDICRPLHGLTVRREELVHVPPNHPHCRTLLQPVFDWDAEPEWGSPKAVEAVPGFGRVPRLSAGRLRAAGVGGPVSPGGGVGGSGGVPPSGPPGGGGSEEGGGEQEEPRAAASLEEYLRDRTTGLPARIPAEEMADIAVRLHREGGGATISPWFGNAADQPFYSVSVDMSRTLKVRGKDLPRSAIVRFLAIHHECLIDPRAVLGTWYDPDTQKTFVDVSVLIADRDVAVQLGRQYNQIGIYNLRAGVPTEDRFVPTGGTGGGEGSETWPAYNERLPALMRGVDPPPPK